MTAIGMTAQAEQPDDLARWLPDQCHYAGTFSQTRSVPALPVALESSGRFLFDCAAGVIWQTQHPLPETIIYTAANFNFRITDSAERLEGIAHSNMASTLRAIMGGETALLLANFKTHSEQDRLLLVPRRSAVARFLERIELTRAETTADILLVNGNQGQTRIVTEVTDQLSSPGFEACRRIFTDAVTICEGLYSPALLAESLGTTR